MWCGCKKAKGNFIFQQRNLAPKAPEAKVPLYAFLLFRTPTWGTSASQPGSGPGTWDEILWREKDQADHTEPWRKEAEATFSVLPKFRRQKNGPNTSRRVFWLNAGTNFLVGKALKQQNWFILFYLGGGGKWAINEIQIAPSKMRREGLTPCSKRKRFGPTFLCHLSQKRDEWLAWQHRAEYENAKVTRGEIFEKVADQAY